MKNRLLASLLALAVMVPASLRADAVDVARAAQVAAKVLEFTQKFKAATATVPTPEPIPNSSGKYVVPFTADGQLTDWAQKALTAQLGAAAGGVAADKATGAALSQVPLGGLFAKKAKDKGKELGALAAIGGMEFVRQSSSLSFNNLADYAVYMHQKYSGGMDFSKGLAAAMAIYPDLVKGYESSIKGAYNQAAKAQK